jgi:hypothetical protein
MASAGQGIRGRGSSGGTSPVVLSPSERERSRCDRLYARTQGGGEGSALAPTEDAAGSRARRRHPCAGATGEGIRKQANHSHGGKK